MIEHLIKQYAIFISSGALLANETLRIIDKHIWYLAWGNDHKPKQSMQRWPQIINCLDEEWMTTYLAWG